MLHHLLLPHESFSFCLSVKRRLSLFFPLEVGHWVNTTKRGVISRVTQWVMSGKVRGTERQVREPKRQRVEGGWSKINFMLASRRHQPKTRKWVELPFPWTLCCYYRIFHLRCFVCLFTKYKCFKSDELAVDFSLLAFLGGGQLKMFAPERKKKKRDLLSPSLAIFPWRFNSWRWK